MAVEMRPSQSTENEENDNEVATARDLQLDLSAGSWREIPKTLWSLITNWTFLFTALYGACDALLVDGFQTFGAKYFQQQFSLTSSMAGIIFGNN
jgi:Organic Anion Transporter Polypeptide (OATP) family